MQERRLAALQDAAGDQAHQPPGIAAPAVVRMGADAADLAESVRPHPLARHGDELARRLHADEAAQRLGAGREGTRPREPGQGQHLGAVRLAQRDNVQPRAVAKDRAGRHLHERGLQGDGEAGRRLDLDRLDQIQPLLAEVEGRQAGEAPGRQLRRRGEGAVVGRQAQRLAGLDGQRSPGSDERAPDRAVERMGGGRQARILRRHASQT